MYVFRTPTDQLFCDFGVILKPTLEPYVSLFWWCWKPWKCNPSCTESLLLTFWGHDFSTFFGTYVKTHSRTCFFQFCCRSGLALGLHFGAFGLTFSNLFSSPQKKQKIRFCVLLRWRYLGHITEEGGNWEASHLEASGKQHLGSIWEASGRPGLRRCPQGGLSGLWIDPMLHLTATITIFIEQILKSN